MTTFLAAGVAILVSAALAFFGSSLPPWWRRVGAGGPIGLGLLAGLATLWFTGAAPSLLAILLGAGLLVALIEIVASLLALAWVWRVLAQVVLLGAVLVFEWRRGDMFASDALTALVVGVLAVTALSFATRAAQSSGAGRTPPLLAVVGAAYLFVISRGIPNPGLGMVVLLIAAAALPLAILRPQPGGEVALGAVLGGAAWASGCYAWMANASPAMVLAPVLVVVVDVGWTLARRLVTDAGRTRLAAAGGWWRRLVAWGEPADDLVTQRAATSGSPRTALVWLFGATAVILLVSLAQWWLGLRWLLELAILLLIALGWLLAQLGTVHLRRPDLIGWLAGLSALALLVAFAAHLTDGRKLVLALPLLVAVAIWPATLIPGRRPNSPLAEPHAG